LPIRSWEDGWVGEREREKEREREREREKERAIKTLPALPSGDREIPSLNFFGVGGIFGRDEKHTTPKIVGQL
jgi:hypothetical protein